MNNFPFTAKMEFVADVSSLFNDDSDCEPPPDVNTLCGVLNVAFWASMQAEEGHPVRASLALVDPALGRSPGIFQFSDPIALSSHAIAKLSASFPFGPGAIGIGFSPQGTASIWGFLLPKPEIGWLIEILGPGYIVVRNAPKMEAALLPDGSQVRFQGARLEDEWCGLFFALVRPNTVVHTIPFEFSDQVYGLIRLLSRAMVGHHRGGSVLLVDPRDGGWRKALDFKYEFIQPEEHIFALIQKWRAWQRRWSRNEDRKLKGKKRPPNELRFIPASQHYENIEQAMKLVGGLTAVDGAMVMTPDFKILGYGAKLKTRARKLKIREWLPGAEEEAQPKDLQGIGGTRHQAAAQFVAQCPETIVLVASQDGRFTIFRSEGAEEVLALRTELLLL